MTKLSTTAFELTIADLEMDSAHSWLSVGYDPAKPDQVMVDDKPLSVRASQGEMELHLYIDGSVIELFVNQQAGFTKRFYYPGPSAPLAGIRINGKTALISTLSIWQLSPISPDRLTS